MYKIIIFFILSCPAWAQESFNIKTSHVISDGYYIPKEVQFIYNGTRKTLNVLDEDKDKDFLLPLRFLYEDYSDNKKFYLLAFAGDPKSPQYITALPSVVIHYDKMNGKITHIEIQYFDVIQKKPHEAAIFVTDYGIDYLEN